MALMLGNRALPFSVVIATDGSPALSNSAASAVRSPSINGARSASAARCLKTARHEWDSAFLGSIAIPRAQQNYPIVVQKLLASLYVDLEFLQALKK